MKYLLILVIFVFGCNKPDYYICPDDKAKEMSTFILRCDEETNAHYNKCVESAQKTFCKPGYKPKDVKECNCPGTATELKPIEEQNFSKEETKF